MSNTPPRDEETEEVLVEESQHDEEAEQLPTPIAATPERSVARDDDVQPHFAPTVRRQREEDLPPLPPNPRIFQDPPRAPSSASESRDVRPLIGQAVERIQQRLGPFLANLNAYMQWLSNPVIAEMLERSRVMYQDPLQGAADFPEPGTALARRAALIDGMDRDRYREDMLASIRVYVQSQTQLTVTAEARRFRQVYNGLMEFLIGAELELSTMSTYVSEQRPPTPEHYNRLLAMTRRLREMTSEYNIWTERFDVALEHFSSFEKGYQRTMDMRKLLNHVRMQELLAEAAKDEDDDEDEEAEDEEDDADDSDEESD
jgi:hypothetical protein